MSTALAIASVTHVLKDLLNDGLINNDVSWAVGGNVIVTALPPDRIDISSGDAVSQINLFMYMATPNQGWSNVGLPSRNSRGERISNPPLSLDLHYLLTAYGVNELHTEILLGYGMQLLHETPVLLRESIRKALTSVLAEPGGSLPNELRALSTSDLAEQVEQIKIIPETLSTEEMLKLWSAFQTKYRPTAAYRATVVLIESLKSTKSSLPVRERFVYAIPFRQPSIDKILSQKNPGDPIVELQKILAGYNLVIQGKQLKGDVVKINTGGIEVTPDIEDVEDKQIIFTLPTGLKAGILGVQVIHQRLIGSPPEPHHGVQSNVEAFVLSPRIDNITVSNVEGTGDELRLADVVLEIAPEIREIQKVILLLNEFAPGPVTEPLNSYSFQATPLTLTGPTGPTTTITIPICGVEAGTYLVRVMVDGAESPLETDALGKYDEPQVTIP